MLDRLRSWARALKRDVVAVYLLARDPRTPWGARLLALAVAAYALSPIDLIPDFIPVLGYLDDVILVPLGIWGVIRLTPAPLIAAMRGQARDRVEARPRSYLAAAVVVGIWLAGVAMIGLWVWKR